MGTYLIFQEVSFGPGRDKITAASSEVLTVVQQAKELGIDISMVEKILWKILILPFAHMFGGVFGFILGFGILIPIVYYQALKWSDFFNIKFYRGIIYLRLKHMVKQRK